jgi:hypothetical protein
MAGVRCEGESGVAMIVPTIKVGTFFDEQPSDLCVALHSGDHQQRPGVLIREIGTKALFQFLSEMDDVAPLDDSARLVEGQCSEPPLAPYVKSSSIVVALSWLHSLSGFRVLINRNQTGALPRIFLCAFLNFLKCKKNRSERIAKASRA